MGENSVSFPTFEVGRPPAISWLRTASLLQSRPPAGAPEASEVPPVTTSYPRRPPSRLEAPAPSWDPALGRTPTLAGPETYTEISWRSRRGSSLPCGARTSSYPPADPGVPCRRRNFDGSDMEPGQPYTGWELFLDRPSCRLAVQVQVRPRPVNLIVEFLEGKFGPSSPRGHLSNLLYLTTV